MRGAQKVAATDRVLGEAGSRRPKRPCEDLMKVQNDGDTGSVQAMCLRGKELLKELAPSSEEIETLLFTPTSMVTDDAVRAGARAAQQDKRRVIAGPRRSGACGLGRAAGGKVAGGRGAGMQGGRRG